MTTAQAPLAASLLAAILLPGAPSIAAGADWPQFLGPTRNGISTERELNLDWNTHAPPVPWRVPLGAGFSSLSIVGGMVYTQVERDGRGWLVCLDATTGDELWSFAAAGAYVDNQGMGAGPRATPTVWEGTVYGLFPTAELCALDAETGALQWQIDVLEAVGADRPSESGFYWGLSGSPLVEAGLVIVQPGGGGGKSVCAFSPKTGQLAWSAGDDAAGYGSPISIVAASRQQVVSTTAQSIVGIDPRSGELLWRYEFGNMFNCNCATPLWSEEHLFVSAAYDTGAACLALVDEGQGLEVRERWRHKQMQNQFATSVILEGFVFGCHGTHSAHVLRCVDLKSGEVKWSDRRAGKCSLIAVEDHLVALEEGGTVRLFQVSPDGCEVRGELSEVLQPKAWAPPALAEGRLYMRDEHDLVCVDLRKP